MIQGKRHQMPEAAKTAAQRFGPAFAVWLPLLVLGCSVPASSGSSQLVSAGQSPGSVQQPPPDRGGIIEIAKVRFAGNQMDTGLVQAIPALPSDGLTLVVGGAAFSLPRTTLPEEREVALAASPGLNSDGSKRCKTVIGQSRSLTELGGTPVDVGVQLWLEGLNDALRFPLLRTPHQRLRADHAYAIAYAGSQVFTVPGSVSWVGNWSSNSLVQLRFSGAAPPTESTLSSIPFGQMITELALPRALDGLSINDVTTALPQRDSLTGEILAGVPEFARPTATSPLVLRWQTWSEPGPLTVALEYLGPGDGQCPGECYENIDCCQADYECGSNHHCEASPADGLRRCFSNAGSSSDRIGALVCSLPDTGEAEITVDLLNELDAYARGTERGIILRVGRTVSLDVVFPDALAFDGSRQPLSPVLVRASDVVISRLTLDAP